MNARTRNVFLAVCVVMFCAFAAGCAVEGGGYYGGPSVDVGVGFDYYDSGGYYGGWGPGYRVGPVHHDGHWDHNDHHDNHGRPPQHSYHPAPSGHRAPSIPSHPRSSGNNRRH